MKRKSVRQLKNINPKDLIGVTKCPVHFVSPLAIVQESIANFLGATKYGAYNWRAKNTAASVYYAALIRHLFLWWCGQDNDDDGTPHLTNARVCLAILMEGRFIGNMRDDRPPPIDLKRAMKEIEALMPHINAKFGHMNPKHWTIEDFRHAKKKTQPAGSVSRNRNRVRNRVHRK